MQNAITRTDFTFPGLKSTYIGKVRDVYNIDDELLIMVTSDRISAFDVVLPRAIPYKGQVLNQIAAKFLEDTSDIVPNWKIATPDPMVTVGRLCEPFKVEMVIRGYLSGHAWREYKAGKRSICGIPMPEGMKENDMFPNPIITPTTKASVGHDEDISKEEILKQGLVSAEDYEMLEKYTMAVFERGTQIASGMGLIWLIPNTNSEKPTAKFSLSTKYTRLIRRVIFIKKATKNVSRKANHKNNSRKNLCVNGLWPMVSRARTDKRFR
jgi:phosphoribosylaminoimidazole-succinocarboxamide synthase